MIITIANFKGGCGKSIIAHQLIAQGWEGIELDPYGNLATRFPDNVEKIALDEPLPELQLPLEFNLLFDTGGFDDEKFKMLLSISNLLVIPFIATGESLQATIDTYNTLNPTIPILWVVNMSRKKQNLKDSIEVLKELSMTKLDKDIDYLEIPFTDSLQTSVNENMGVVEMSKRKGLIGYPYRNIAQIFIDLEKRILNYGD